MRLKKSLITFIALGIFLSQAACSGSSGGSASSRSDYAADSYSDYSQDSYEDYSEEAAEDYDAADSEELEVSEDGEILNTASKKTSNLNLDMLVYRCDVTIDTLDYEKSYDDLLKLISEYGGFVESSEYTDNGSNYSYYYIESSDKHLECNITARIPSDKYDKFTSEFSGLGDVRSMSANVENVTQEYTDSETALKIYREQEKRYIAMIADADASYAMELQTQLTELEIKIAKLESRMQNIRNDVAYSYVDVRLREVEKYTLHDTTDTFSMRMKDNLSESWTNFLDFLESVLRFFIYMWYYIILLILIIVLSRKAHRAWRAKHPKKEVRNKKYQAIYKHEEIEEDIDNKKED